MPSLRLELRTFVQSFDIFEISFWSQRISVPSLVQIGSQTISRHMSLHANKCYFMYKKKKKMMEPLMSFRFT